MVHASVHMEYVSMCGWAIGHLPFSRLKQLAINGKIPKKLAKVAPPRCAGCLFHAMTKIPWRGK
jgi:hypothetical protein